MPRTVRIPLTRGYVAIIDAKDAPLVAGYRWHANVSEGGVYAKARVPGGTRVSMHRLIMGLPACMVDHKSGETLDNRRSNLRLATNSENQRNKSKNRKSRSRFKGVCLHKRSGRWQAEITVNRSKKYLGLFANEYDACAAYDRAALELHGEFARLNFPLATS